jgi:hypothetical protein
VEDPYPDPECPKVMDPSFTDFVPGSERGAAGEPLLIPLHAAQKGPGGDGLGILRY